MTDDIDQILLLLVLVFAGCSGLLMVLAAMEARMLGPSAAEGQPSPVGRWRRRRWHRRDRDEPPGGSRGEDH